MQSNPLQARRDRERRGSAAIGDALPVRRVLESQGPSRSRPVNTLGEGIALSSTSRAMNQYQFAKGFKEFDEDAVTAQVAGDELERIKAKRGQLDPQGIVHEARPEDAPLHPVFEWDNAIAAESYRCVQARDLIKTVEVIQPEVAQRRSEPAYVNVSTKAPQYRSTAEVAKSPELFESAFRQACERLGAAARAVEHLQEIAKRERPESYREYGKVVYVLRQLQTMLSERS